MALSAVLSLPRTSPTSSSRPAAVKVSPNKEHPHPQPWQKTASVAMKDFNIADIRTEFDCSKAGWATVDIEVHSMLNGFADNQMKDSIVKVIQEDPDLRGHQFHELSVPVLKNVVQRAVDILISYNPVVCKRLANPSSENGLQRKAEELWLRQLLLAWFTKQFTNRRTERLKSKKRPVKCETCSGCGGDLKCILCNTPSSEIELVGSPYATED